MSRLVQISSVKRTTALCYIRQSLTRDANDTNSPERQRGNIQVICDQNGWTPEWYQDADGHKSGRFESNRPAWLALKARLTDPDVVALVANDTSRLHRKSWRIGDLLDFLQEHQIRLVLAASKQEVDLTGIGGLVFAQLAAIFDEWYAADISRRAKDSVAHRKSQGKVAGAIPFGTMRNADGYLEPSTEGGWWLPDGQFVAGEPNHCPDDGAAWRSYYESAKRTLTLYTQNRRGLELIAYQLNMEGWPFRDRSGEPRAINKDDVRRIIRNWPEYGGIVLEKASKKRHPREFDPDHLPFVPEHAVFSVDLLETVAKTHIERARAARNNGVRKHVRIYVLNGITYCAHCERLALQHNNPKLRTRLKGGRNRYVHKEGMQCGNTNRSVLLEEYEAAFGKLIRTLTIRPEALQLMTELAIQVQKLRNPQADEPDLETQKQDAIALCKRRIDAAVILFGDGRISRDEYLRRVEENEREIAHWEARTTETEKTALELAMCMDALNKLDELWETGEPEDRQNYLRTLFTSVVYDLDARRIMDFKLKPWADRFLVMRSALYSDGNTTPSQTGTGTGLEPLSSAMLPAGYERRASADPEAAAAHILRVLYNDTPMPTKPQSSMLPTKEDRNRTIYNRYLAGERAADLAKEFKISVRRVNRLIRRYQDRENPSTQ